MTTEEEDSDEHEERNEGLPTLAERARAAVRAAYYAATYARLGAAPDDHDIYVKLGLVLLAAGSALEAEDSAALGALATQARVTLDKLGVDWKPVLSDEQGMPVDPDNVGGALLQEKDFPPRAAARVKELLSAPMPAMTLGPHLARIVRSGPWREICRERSYLGVVGVQNGQEVDGQRVGKALEERIGTVLDPSVTNAREVLRVALEALGATNAESKRATRGI